MPRVVRMTRVDMYKDRSYCTTTQGHFSINKKASQHDPVGGGSTVMSQMEVCANVASNYSANNY